jgi:hypothetical protein
VLKIGQEGVTGMGGEGSARRRLNRGEGKMGTAGPAQAHGKGRRRGGGGWSVRGEEGPGQGTDLGTADAGGALCGNRGGAGTGTWAAVGEAAGTAAMGSA